MNYLWNLMWHCDGKGNLRLLSWESDWLRKLVFHAGPYAFHLQEAIALLLAKVGDLLVRHTKCALVTRLGCLY